MRARHLDYAPSAQLAVFVKAVQSEIRAARGPLERLYKIHHAHFQQFAAANFDNRFFRFVNADDIVPRVPPGYVHIGQLTHFDSQGSVSTSNLESSVSSEPSNLSMLEFEAAKQALQAEKVRELESAQLEGLLPNYFSDHSLVGYLTKIMKNLPKLS